MTKRLVNLLLEATKALGLTDNNFVRARNALARGGISDVGQFRDADWTRLSKIRCAGPVAMEIYMFAKSNLEELDGIGITVYLSHPMNGLTEDEVLKIRKKALRYLRSRYGTVTLIDNYHHEHDDAPKDAGRLWHLGTSIRMMEQADGVYFCGDWQNAKGCQIEYEICKTYGIRILN